MIRDALRRIAKALGRREPPRQARLVGIGAPRTGTHSLAAMFDRSIRARHEPGLRAAMRKVVDHSRGRCSFDDLRAFVRRRDERMRLDVDASHVNAHLAAAIAAEFADARFVLTIRDPFSWMDSAMSHTLNTGRGSRTDREYLAFWLDGANDGHGPHDAILRDLGLPCVDTWLGTWRRHNETAIANVPEERLLVVKTAEISNRLHDIAAFAGIAGERVVQDFRAAGLARAKRGVLARLDPAFVEARVAERCQALMARFFPDIRSFRDAGAFD